MQDQDKTKEQLIQEVAALRQRVVELEAIANTCTQTGTVLQAHQQELEQQVKTGEIALASSHEQLAVAMAERQSVEAALRNAQDRLRAMIEAVPGIVSWIGADLRYLGVNRRLACNYGLTPEAFVGKDIGFLNSSSEFKDFVEEFFDSSAQDDFREITAFVNGEPRKYLLVVQKYDSDRAALVVGIDITERHQTEGALRQAEAKYRSIFENSTEGIFQTSLDGHYLSANPRLAHIYGYDSPEALIASITDVRQQLYVDPDRREEFARQLQQEGELTNFESQVYRTDGSLIWISEKARAVYDDNGKIICYEGTVEDITERKRAEETLKRVTEELELRVEERTTALKELNRRLRLEISERQRVETALRTSEAELRALFAAMTDVITVFDGQGRYLKMVTTNSELPYLPEVDRIGKTVYEVLPSEQAALFISHIQRAMNTGATVSLEYCLPVSKPRTPDAPSEAWFAANVSPLPDHRVIWVARDITVRKQAEEALRQSEASEREKSQQLAQTLQKLQQTQTQLVQSEKMSSLGQLVAGVAHEINNPVNFIYGNLVYATRYTKQLLTLLQCYQQSIPNPDPDLKAQIEAIDLEFLQADLPKLMNSMRVGAERIREIVRSLQSFSRLDGAELKVVDVHEGLDSSLMILQHRLKSESQTTPEIQVIRDYGDLPPVKCYAGQLNQVLMNILSNAIDAIEEAGRNRSGIKPTIRIHTETLNREECDAADISDKSNVSSDRSITHIAIRIIDNGSGMSEAVCQRVFDPFFTTKPVGKGTGLGMSISHQIVVERHGGAISCVSKQGEGTEFIIELPLQPGIRTTPTPSLQSTL